jgi:transposase
VWESQVWSFALARWRGELTKPAGANRRLAEAAVPWLRCHAQAGFSFRAILRGGKVTTLHRWMEEVRKTGIYSLVRFVRTLKQDLSAVETAVREPWSNGPVEGQL